VIKCPCCGSELGAAELLVDLNTNTIEIEGSAREVWRPQVVELLYILREAWPRTVSYEVIGDGIWGMLDQGRTAAQIRQHLATLATWARHALKGTGVEIECVASRGYRLVLPRQRKVIASPLARDVSDRRVPAP